MIKKVSCLAIHCEIRFSTAVIVIREKLNSIGIIFKCLQIDEAGPLCVECLYLGDHSTEIVQTRIDFIDLTAAITAYVVSYSIIIASKYCLEVIKRVLH